MSPALFARQANLVTEFIGRIGKGQQRRKQKGRASQRALLFEPLEDRRVMAAAVWRNPVDALDADGDSFVVPLDALRLINDLNGPGSRQLAAVKDAALPFLDVDGDGFIAPIDALRIINHLNLIGSETGRRRLTESGVLANESTVTISLGQAAGSRIYRVQLDATFDTTDNQAAIEDLLAVYLVDPDQPTQTLLDRGTAGTALFTLAGTTAEYATGPVRWNGSVLEIDTTGLAARDTGLLKFQLLSSDADTGTRVTIKPLTNEVDADGQASPAFASSVAVVTAGPAANLTNLAPSASSEVRVENVRFRPDSGRYSAELRLQNDTASLGREVAIVFPNLPAGVTLRNPSGTTTGGAPYINVQPAIPRGGLEQGVRSEPVLVEFDDPTQIPFAIKPQVLAGTNHAPTLASIAPLTVFPGGVLKVPLQATDVDGDPITFAVAGIENLPTGRLKPNGKLEFRPTPTQLGSYQFDVTASDGMLTATRSVTLNVVADPVTTTRVSGQVLRVNGQPLSGMRVEIGAVQALTMPDGSFTLDLGNGPLVTDTLKIRGELFAGPLAYPFIAEKLPLILEHSIFASANNVIDRPIYLPELDVANGVTINPAQDTTVTTSAIPGAAVMVRAGTLMNQQGTPFTGALSITKVPTDLTPAALPPNLIADLVVTIQPGEMVFASPAPLTFPNPAGWPAGTLMDLWSINPVTGTFDDVGDMRVSPDGTKIETISGGVRNSSWHFPAPPPPTPTPVTTNPQNRDAGCSTCTARGQASSEVEFHSGAIVETHALVPYQSLGVSRGLMLTYDSERADPRPILHFGFDNTPADANQRLVAKLSFSRGGFTEQVPGFAGEQFGLTGGEHFWSLPGGNIDGALQGDLRSQPSGRYDYTLSSGLLRLRDQVFSGSLADQQGRLIHVNSIGSPFGNGWGLAGLQQLVENPDGSVLLINGDGNELLFEKPTVVGGAYDSPPGDFSTFERLGNGLYRRTMTDQTVFSFNAQRRLESVRDRVGNETRYTYDANGVLTKVTDPVGLETAFSSTQGRITSITDPANRVTQLTYDAAGNLIRVTNPDGSQRTWGYDSDRHMTSEIDQRGQREATSYHFSGRAISSTRKDGSVLHFTPVQIQGLYAPEATVNPLQAPRAFPRGKAEATYLDGNGNVVRKTLDQAGQEVTAADAVGPLPTTQRNADNLVTQIRDGRGQTTEFTYDNRGDVLTVRDSLSRGGQFIDISETGDPVPGLKDNDDRSVLINLPFPFTFYGVTYTQIGVSSNGVVSFGGTNTEYSNVALSSASGSLDSLPSLLPFWDDLETRTDEDFVSDVFTDKFGPAGSQEFVIQWHQLEHYSYASQTGDVTFEVVLTQGTNAIRFNYGDVHFTNTTETNSGAGKSATVGIWNSNTQFQQFSFNTASLRDGLTLNVTESGITEAGGSGVGEKRFTYDPTFSQLTSATDELNRQTLFDVDPTNGNALAQTQVVGAVGGADDVVSRMTYTARGQLATMTDPNGHVTRFDYDPLGRLITLTEAVGTPEQGVSRFEYDAAGNITASIDENGNRTTYQFDAMNRRTRVTEADPDGAGPLAAPVTQFTFDAAGNLVRLTDARNHSTQFTYDSINRLTSNTNPIGGVHRLTYDSAGNVISSVDELGRETRYRYDARNRMIETIDATGGRAFIKYDADNNPVIITDENGHPLRIAYDARGRVVRETDALGKSTVNEYNAADDLIAVTDRNGHQTQYAYDDLARQTTVTDARGGVMAYEYDPAGNLVALTDQLNRRSQSTYDARDRNISVTSAFGNTVNFVYDAASNLTATRDGLNQNTQYAYDALNRRVRRTDALNGTLTYVYDSLDNLVAMTNELGRTWQYAYDDLDRQISMTDPLSHVTQLAYDSVDNLISSTDGLGQVTNYEYDVLDRQTKITDARGGISRFAYDAVGNLLSLTDPVNNATQFAYDALNRQVRETNPLGANRTYAFDAVGNLTSQTDRNGRVRRFTYDELDRQTTEQWLDATSNPIRTITSTFDAASQLTAATDPDSTYAYLYDLDGRSTSVSNAGTPGAPTVVFGYTYDAAHNQQSRTDTIAGQLRGTNGYSYDVLNRMIRVTQSGTGVTNKRVDLAYDAASQMTGVNRFADLAGTQLVSASAYSYDAANRLTGLTHTRNAATLAAYTWIYDAANRITQTTSPDGTSNFSYDTTNQLTGANHSAQTDESYSYDLNGNRTNAGYQTGPNNELTAASPDSYTYDAEGNRITRTNSATGEVVTYSWDHRNRLAQIVTKNAAGVITMQATYTYDMFDRRIAKTVDNDGAGPAAAQTERFVYDGVHIALTFDGSGAQTHRYLHGPAVDQIFADEDATGELMWSLSDHQGTVRDLVNSSGVVQNHLTYDTFGTIVSESNPAIDFRFAYTGRELDFETGLYYYRARYYASAVGRFLSEDPLGFANGDANHYPYVNNNPISNLDWNGMHSTGVAGHLTVHQDSIDRVLVKLSEADRKILRDQQVIADEDQSPEGSYTHAMRSPNQTVEEARQMSNKFVREQLEAARAKELESSSAASDCEKQSLHQKALEHLGKAMHAIQDATSPAHAGFQEWKGPGGPTQPVELSEAGVHVFREINPAAPGGSLDTSTQRAYDYFSGARPLPDDFFSVDGSHADHPAKSLVDDVIGWPTVMPWLRGGSQVIDLKQ